MTENRTAIDVFAALGTELMVVLLLRRRAARQVAV
jgi:hypothetical protein